jgi:hypothetical protein
MRTTLLIAALAAASTMAAQTPPPGKPIGSWVVEYDHTSFHMHGEPTHRHDQGRMTLRSVGDSLFGELMIGDSTMANRSTLRGVAGKGGWTLYAEEPTARGFGIFFSALGSAMDWLRESVHGIHPVVIRFDVVAKGDSLVGTRSVSGGMGSPRSSAISGRKLKTP